jgi:hypothetical protein
MRKKSPQRARDLKPDATEHYTRLADEFGMPRGGRYTATDDGRPMTGARFWFQPVTLFILSLIALALVGGAQLWRMGLFDSIFGPKSAQVEKGSKRWMLNRNSARSAADVVNVDEPDYDHGPPPPPSEDEASTE